MICKSTIIDVYAYELPFCQETGQLELVFYDSVFRLRYCVNGLVYFSPFCC
jgi:hypothetical protein